MSERVRVGSAVARFAEPTVVVVQRGLVAVEVEDLAERALPTGARSRAELP